MRQTSPKSSEKLIVKPKTWLIPLSETDSDNVETRETVKQHLDCEDHKEVHSCFCAISRALSTVSVEVHSPPLGRIMTRNADICSNLQSTGSIVSSETQTSSFGQTGEKKQATTTVELGCYDDIRFERERTTTNTKR